MISSFQTINYCLPLAPKKDTLPMLLYREKYICYIKKNVNTTEWQHCYGTDTKSCKQTTWFYSVAATISRFKNCVYKILGDNLN